MRALRLTISQLGYVNKAFWRNPTQAFFTFAFPLMFLVIFTALLGHGKVNVGRVTLRQSTYYVASMASFGVIAASYTNIAISMVFRRDLGILKRIHGTPLPSGSFLAARVAHSMFVAVVLVVISTAFGRAAYSASVPSGTALFHFLVMLVVGSATFCALGLALTGAIPNPDAGTAIVNASILPLLFLSGIFIPFGNNTPPWILWVGRIFPVRHFALGIQSGYVPTPFQWSDVAVVAAWGIGGLLVASRYFSWEPRR